MARSLPLAEIVELDAMPRSQVGPFFALCVAKTADKEAIEAAWAQRLIWARKGLTPTPLEDINWAREMLRDWTTRIRADAVSLNVETSAGFLQEMRERFQTRHKEEGCQPLDIEKTLAAYTPPIPVPPVDEVRQAVPMPQVPLEIPAVQTILDAWLGQPLDPWEIAFTPQEKPTPNAGNF